MLCELLDIVLYFRLYLNKFNVSATCGLFVKSKIYSQARFCPVMASFGQLIISPNAGKLVALRTRD